MGDLRGSKRCTIPVEQADGGVGGAGRGHTDGERHLCLAVGSSLCSSNRDVTICMESVSDDLHSTGYGWLLLMVTGIFCVSTTFTLPSA